MGRKSNFGKIARYNLVGVVGGVGPEASNKFCEMLINFKSKEKDQDNIPFIHFSNSQIPDRTDFILGKGASPIPELVKTCKTLENSGADFLIIPCNTAHCFLEEIQNEIGIPIVDMIKIMVNNIIDDNPMLSKVGLLATTGSIESDLFQKYFDSANIETIIPNMEDQENFVMNAIYGPRGIKAGKKKKAGRLLKKAVKKLNSAGAQVIVLGCTEIPLVLQQKDFKIRLYDPMEIVAKEIINYLEANGDTEVVTVKHKIKENQL